jgi:hypothetical protein
MRTKAEAEARAKLERERKALETAREKEAARQDRETQRTAKATSGPLETTQAGLRGMAKGTCKDVAAMMTELLVNHETPDDLFMEFVALAKVSGALSKSTIRHIEAFLLASKREETAKPAA